MVYTMTSFIRYMEAGKWEMAIPRESDNEHFAPPLRGSRVSHSNEIYKNRKCLNMNHLMTLRMKMV